MYTVANIKMCTHPLSGSVMFTPEQRAVLMRYFEEYGMTSTHRRNTELMQRCAQEINTTIERIKVFDIRLVITFNTHTHTLTQYTHTYLAVFNTLNIVMQNWIGAEAVKRKRKAGILPRPKIEIAGVSIIRYLLSPKLHTPFTHPHTPSHTLTHPHTPFTHPHTPFTHPHTPSHTLTPCRTSLVLNW